LDDYGAKLMPVVRKCDFGMVCTRCLRVLDVGEKYGSRDRQTLCIPCIEAKQNAQTGGKASKMSGESGRVIRDPRGL
jgi:hypothetical protein